MNLYFLISILPVLSGAMQLTYNYMTAETGVWLSGAAYCEKNTYDTMQLAGPAEDFQYYETLYDKPTDLQGYVGVIQPTNQIYVVFRGSTSTRNWLDNAEIMLTSYTTFPECNCKVHSGFYKSSNNIYPSVHEYVNDMLDLFPSYNIIVTGHSYGAAVAQLISMELLSNGIANSLYNYGQPRVGNIEYAKFVNIYLKSLWRFTHHKDMVPHVPPMTGLGYYHSCVEIYENEYHDLHMCSDIDGEDPTCAAQFALYQTDTTDHHIYLNHALDCNESTIQ
jgi:hypothetical protein